MNRSEKEKIAAALSAAPDWKNRGLRIIPDSFKCPGPAIEDGTNEECEVFGSTNWFCPYSSMPAMHERRFNHDCKFAPEGVWKGYKTFGERIVSWVEENS